MLLGGLYLQSCAVHGQSSWGSQQQQQQQQQQQHSSERCRSSFSGQSRGYMQWGAAFSAHAGT